MLQSLARVALGSTYFRLGRIARLIALRHDARVTPASLEIVKRFEMWRASFETRNVSDGGTSSDENHDEIPITRLEESLISGQVLRLREIFEDIDLDETSW